MFRATVEREITASVKAGNAVRVSKGTRVEVLGQTVDSEGNSWRKVKLLFRTRRRHSGLHHLRGIGIGSRRSESACITSYPQ